MANRPKQIGTAQESAIVTWFRRMGWNEAERKTLKGSGDEGDVTLGFHVPVVIESKGMRGSTERVTLSSHLKELEDEIENADAETGVVIIKKKGTTDVGQYYALLPVWRYERLLSLIYDKRRVVRLRRMK